MLVFGRTTVLGALRWLAVACLCVVSALGAVQVSTVTAEVSVIRPGHQRKTSGSAAVASQVAVWLTPLDGAVLPTGAAAPSAAKPPELIQRNKSFEPHVLVVQVGTVVLFPNKDPLFHNIFSMYDGKRFDLGLYEAGTTRSVRFDRPGVSFLFCNIHAEMSAVVVAVETPYFALSDRSGHIAIPNVPDGRYQLHVWYERSLPESLAGLTKLVSISENSHSLGPIRVTENPDFTFAHKNKYGEDYVPPAAPSYEHP
jgi:plastocyanin